ncbi:hypothetical protein EGK75_08280 [Neisseria weixii]|uniref:Conjugal transfer protein TraN n=1 Tax=Neisseria weixii TaxID=1853276 RepID=A0A3N4N480_9NEIS|nr:hypothetical protein [Neisseria weixii]RPD86129.1 hypothetical protein EGK74_08535 [Neisseria weixii]RPD86862.1 hypothetical protein EGK75_08280 [Neisseria weixii]
MNVKTLSACVLFWVFQTASAADYSGYLKELGGLGSGTSKNITAPEKYTPRYTDNPPNAEQYYGGGLSLPTSYGEAKIAGCRDNVADSDLYLRQECEGVNFIANNKTQRPDVTLRAREKLITGTQSIAGDPAETLDKYKWRYPLNADGSVGSIPSTACPTETITVPAVKSVKNCSEYYGAELFLCEAALKVTVDPNWNYSCLETKYQHERYSCSKKLKVTCEQAPDCTTAGVEAGTMQGDMQLSFVKNGGDTAHTLTFGSIGDDYFRNNQYDREMMVKIKNLKQLSVFTLKRVEYDDWLVVKVNDAIVYSSYGNQMLSADFSKNSNFTKPRTAVLDESGNWIGAAERKTSWKKDLNIDIRPYLKEGDNMIWTRTIAGGGGESAAIFNVHQYCEPICTESWENGCGEFENKVRP